MNHEDIPNHLNGKFQSVFYVTSLLTLIGAGLTFYLFPETIPWVTKLITIYIIETITVISISYLVVMIVLIKNVEKIIDNNLKKDAKKLNRIGIALISSTALYTNLVFLAIILSSV